ncbi:hypothetical protein [Poseidonocella sedimentorum]|uniref:Uncharacterized protein n=1 Tax=Poseidonocella sedimentorum TaxID=871652 RepID=A0A1I6D480_9RHOB|nr:hypothetical protein [Poseidonocella sedimentorum]SFR00122.1 hypothetical protein SAMN04515673_10293 [Poseidonocella sedimentorum]
MSRLRHAAALGLGLLAIGAQPATAQSIAEQLNDYPTVARADYVFGCMAVNGQGRDVLEKCACSIDTIASILPYERYVQAETVLSMQQVGGERMSMFRSATMPRAIVADLRRAQAEAEILCF